MKFENKHGPDTWTENIGAFAHLYLPLLPCGAGDSFKAPLINNWQNKGWTDPLALIADYGHRMKCVGLLMDPPQTGGLVAFDLDGLSAVQKAQAANCNPDEPSTWVIGRTTDELRLKVVFKVPEPWPTAPGKTIIRADEGEQIEVFWSSGQILVAGHHVSSGGQYIWRGGSTPDEIRDIPHEWMALWMSGIQQSGSAGGFRHLRSPAKNSLWSDCVPCAICGRTEPDCRISSEGNAILCHYGNRWSPPVLAKGETIECDAITWAYCGDRTTAIGNAALFRIHQEESKQELCQKRVEPGLALKLMAEQLGDMPKLNVRTRGIHIKGHEANLRQTETLYLHLSKPTSTHKWSPKIAKDAFIELAHQNEFDPVAVYLNNLKVGPLPDEDWKYLGRFLFNIEDEIADAFLPRYLVSAVARVINPGCQVRQTPVLMGGQGIGKTEMGRALFGADHYGDGLTPALDIDDVTRLQYVWGMELGELNGLTRRTQQEKLKAFLSRRADLVRRKYAPGTEPIQRRSVFWATTNKSPLTDNTGSTRFVMIQLGDDKLPVSRVLGARDAIWARAYAEFRSGLQYWSTDEEMDAILKRNADYDLVDPWSEILGDWLKCQGTAAYVKRDQIYDFLKILPERQNNYNAQRIRELMEHLGWVYDRRRIGKNQWVRGFWNPCHPCHPK